MSKERDGRHVYSARVEWTGNRGEGTASYDGYARSHRIAIAGKPDIHGSADPAFRGDADRHNPEDLFVASLSACHMLVFLALCARHDIIVTEYEDRPTGTLVLDARGGRFEAITLRPVVTVMDGAEHAARLHEAAHERCFLARSCSAPIHVEPTVVVATEAVAPAVQADA